MMYHQPQGNQMPCAPVCYPTMSPQMYYGDYPTRMSSTHGQWPVDDGSHGYTSPPVHCHGHGCCNHNYFPGHFAMRPPYPYHHHVSPPPSFSPFYYPAVQGMYPPAPYFPPYEYGKDMSMGGRDSWCGWFPNHPSGGKQEKHVRIEEEEPEVEKKTNGSLVPFEAKNYPYPFVWLQPDNMFNTDESKKSGDSRYKGRDKILGAQAGENPKSFSQHPILWNGWFPYDMSRVQSANQEEEQKSNTQKLEEGAKPQQPSVWRGRFPFDLSNLETMKQGDEQGSNQHQNDDDKKINFPFPVFWMPYKPSLTEREQEPRKLTERDVCKKTTAGEEEVPSHIINFQPEKHTDKKEKPERCTTTEEGPNLSKANSVVKIIPVKQLVPQVEGDEKKSSKIEDERKKKQVEDCANKESTAPRKTSKLPPVCLRIEPLPKRKGTNGKSRSPSPPGNKRKSDDASGKQAEPVVLPNLQKNDRHDDQAAARDRSKEEEKISKSTGTRAAEVAEQANRQEREVKLDGTSGDTVSHSEGSNKCNEEPAAASHAISKKSGDLEPEVTKTDAQPVTTKDSSGKTEEGKKVKFSDAEAATIIQAAYHGFEVRKSGTLSKLKKLAEIKEQVAGIKTRIQALESSCDVKNYDKQKTIITEMIMGLLLKLDSVQGLHTSVRDVRKSIAKELVSLQESLDALVITGKSAEAQLEQPSGISFEGCMPNSKNEDTSTECRREDNGIEIHDLSEIDHKVSPPVDLCEKQVHETDSLPNPEELEKSEVMVTKSLEEEMKNGQGCTSTEYFPGASDSAAIVGGSKKEHTDSQSPMVDSSHGDEELELSIEMPNYEDVSKDEIGKEASNVLPLKDASSDDPKKRVVSGDAVKDITDADEVIILNQEQVSLEESQEGSEECKEEEKITDGTHLERPHESNDMSLSPLEEKSLVDTQTEVPNKSTNTCEADETTRSEIHIASEQAADSWEPDETVSQALSGLGRQVDELPEDQKEQSLIEVSHLVHDEVQFEQGVLQDEEHGWERASGSNSGSEAAVPQHECLNVVSSLEHDALQFEIQKEDHGQGVNRLSETGSGSDDTCLLLTTPEEVTDGLRKECGHLANEESSVKEELQEENDYVFVSGASEVFPDSCIRKSEEMVNIAADEMVNINPVVIPLGKMEATCLAPEDSERTQHVTGVIDQADELDLSMPSPTASQASVESEATREIDRKLVEENEKLRDMMEKLLEAGSKQLSTISELSSRINDLEKKLARKKKKPLKCRRRPKTLSHREVSV